MMPSNHLIFCYPLLLLPSIFPSIRVFSNELALRIRWPKYQSFSSSISPSNEYYRLISFRMDWLDLLAVGGILKSSPTPQFKSINSSALSLLSGPTLTTIREMEGNKSSFEKEDPEEGPLCGLAGVAWLVPATAIPLCSFCLCQLLFTLAPAHFCTAST